MGCLILLYQGEGRAHNMGPGPYGPGPYGQGPYGPGQGPIWARAPWARARARAGPGPNSRVTAVMWESTPASHPDTPHELKTL